MHILQVIQEMSTFLITMTTILVLLIAWLVLSLKFRKKFNVNRYFSALDFSINSYFFDFWKWIMEHVIPIFFVKSAGDIEEMEEEEIVELYHLNYRRVRIFILLGYIALVPIILAILKTFDVEENVIKIALAIIFLHFIVSWFNIVGKKERGALFFFEKPLYNVDKRGLCFVPFGIATLHKELRTKFEDELPANPEKIYRVERGEQDVVPIELLKEGFRPPLRITFSGLTKEELEENRKYRETGGINVDDPFEERLTVEIPGIVIWRIVDVIKFVGAIGSVEDAQKIMGDLYISVLTTILSKITLKRFLEEKEVYDEIVEKELKKLVVGWGIEIDTASIKEKRESRELNILIQKIAEAKALKRVDALRGKGEGDKEENILIGRTDGYKYMAEQTGISIESVISSETTRKISENVDNLVVVGSEGMSDILKIVAAGSGILQSKDKTTTKDVTVKEIDGGEVSHE